MQEAAKASPTVTEAKAKPSSWSRRMTPPMITEVSDRLDEVGLTA
jgi:hypothetical protein